MELGYNGLGIAYTYDAYGNVKREMEMDGQIYRDYTYDVNGNRTSFTLKKGTEVLQRVSYSYDELDRLTEADFGGEVGKVTYSYDGNGRLLSESRGGIATGYTYNRAGLTTQMTNSEGSSYHYSYRLDGNMTEKRDSENGRTEYIYDGIGQLRGETQKDRNGATTMENFYHYDSRGNRMEKNDVHNNRKTTYRYNGNNQLLQAVQAPLYGTPEEAAYREETNYEYDENGNVIFKWKEGEYPVAETEGGETYEIIPPAAGTAGTRRSYCKYFKLSEKSKVIFSNGLPQVSRIISGSPASQRLLEWYSKNLVS